MRRAGTVSSSQQEGPWGSISVRPETSSLEAWNYSTARESAVASARVRHKVWEWRRGVGEGKGPYSLSCTCLHPYLAFKNCLIGSSHPKVTI